MENPLPGIRPQPAVDPPPLRIALTGATGYVGGRLAPRLLAAGHSVRCLVRDVRKLDGRVWRREPGLEVVACDFLDPGALRAALDGCDAAYYLIHSMESAGSGFASLDQRLAQGFGDACAAAGVARIVYLGGLGELGEGLSPHLRSRREVEEALAEAGVPVTSFRAAMIVGAGSASFEIQRSLVERLPVMITPRWERTASQPIAIDNVLHYLEACLRNEATTGRSFDIGGPEVLDYRALMRLTAAAIGLPRRWILPVPVLTPRLSSLWIHLVTPVSAKIARPLAEGLRNPTVCRDDEITRLLPQRLLPMAEAIELAVGTSAETRWSDAGAVPGDADWAGGTELVDRRTTEIAASPERVFAAVCRVGGGNGWYTADVLWRLRGALDKLVGGPGLRRGRRDPERVRYGEALDFWRVEDVVEPVRLLLRAEMKLPGAATLMFEIEPAGPTGSRLTQTARFRPRGFLGLVYWYALLPFHGFVFAGMSGGVRRYAERERPGPSG